ncbi:GNAT family N-acetyltransferase [Flavobacterium macacae]|uniref:GNAT family N-acetyltransferase n=1 Tax=Flavobacterium macacae TaxID=2488993 RepID=A0A3P3WD48_9FLAO|nr:GNAT family N-acetyltransferase [Flavobacterium macacae]RRJ90503.1 GNAT family N-acetyltransferase [Flavobacterium macacae]
MNAIIIREIQKTDNVAIAQVIRDVLIEHNVPKVGTAYADLSLDFMFENYATEKSVYFVVEMEGKIIGGAGIAPLENGPKEICELQKMYFLSEARGLGLGAKLMEVCLEKARQFEFKKCYLETMPYMAKAQNLYKKSGFEYLEKPLGNTGHNACPVWMLKKL